ncbi:unnamed protein product [Sympodiomycopsis kandeliae]
MQGFNMGRYRPWDSDPRRDSFNSHTGTHALGKRGRQESSKGILIVRFELPFPIWCLNCNQSLAQGTRYNAEKKHVDDYYSTKIYHFTCKCRHCSHAFVIRNDPQYTRYVVVSGAKEKMEVPDQDSQDMSDGVSGKVIDLSNTDSLRGRSQIGDMTGRLEHSKEDPFARLDSSAKVAALNERTQQLEQYTSSRNQDPYTLNASLRSSFRTEKKARLAIEHDTERQRREIGWSEGKRLLIEGDDPDRNTEERRKWRAERMHKSKKSSGTSARETLMAKVAPGLSLGKKRSR